MITNVKEVMDFVYASYFNRIDVVENRDEDKSVTGTNPSDDRNNRRPDITANMLSILGRPDLNGRNILVTGSKGKGSVSRVLEGILRAHDIKTGLFTSPHLHTYNERIV